MDNSRLTQPWYKHSPLYTTPRSVILKLALGETPESIPAFADARLGARAYATTVDGGGPVDQTLSKYSDASRVSRIHSAAASIIRTGERHRRYNDLEQQFGMARTLRIDVAEDCNIGYLLNAIRSLNVVEEAYPHYLSTMPFNDRVEVQSVSPEAAWAARDLIHAAEAAAYQPGDPAIIVAVVDTGAALEHPELHGLLRHGFDSVNLGKDDLPGGIHLVGDTSEADTDPTDFVGHGTSCFGIIGGAGISMPTGLAFGCSQLPIRSLGSALFPGRPEPVGIGGCADIDRGMKMAVDLGARVINCSFGTAIDDLDAGDPIPHRDVVEYALARGCVLVAASGNSGQEQAYTPCALEGVIAVGAVGADRRPTQFSTRGSHVAITAPGERVLSAGLDGYSLVTGTSFATPFVTATCALLVSRAAQRSRPLDAGTVRRILVDSAASFPAGVEGKHGAGILDAIAALRLLDRYIDERPDEESRLPASPILRRAEHG